MSHNWHRDGEKRQKVWARNGVFGVLRGFLEYFGVFSERAEEVEISLCIC